MEILSKLYRNCLQKKWKLYSNLMDIASKHAYKLYPKYKKMATQNMKIISKMYGNYVCGNLCHQQMYELKWLYNQIHLLLNLDIPQFV